MANIRWEAGELRDKIRRIIRDLDEHHKNVNIATASGSAASVVGGVLTVLGGILAIPTAGLTLPLAGVGAGLAAAGGAVAIGASIEERIIQKNNVSEIQERLERFQRDFAGYYSEYTGSDETSENILNIAGQIIEGVIGAQRGYRMIKDGIAAARAVGASRVGSTLASGVKSLVDLGKAGQVARIAGYGSQALGKAFFVANVVLIPLSLLDLVRSAAAADRGEPSAASATLERLADFLDHVARDTLG